VLGFIRDGVVAAPIAIYRTGLHWRGPAYVMIQHGKLSAGAGSRPTLHKVGRAAVVSWPAGRDRVSLVGAVRARSYSTPDLAHIRGDTGRDPFRCRPLVQLGPRSNQPL
jgi:hypothetical protein